MKPDFEIEHLDPKELRANPLNFRRHPDLQRQALAGSLSEHGWLAAPIWNKRSGHLLDGHARVELAVEQAETLIPVRVIDVPIAQEKRILRAFDRIGGMAEEDSQALDRLIEEIGDVNLERLLGEITESESGLLPEADPDAIPEVVETRAKAGDLWLLGEHRLLCGDCTVATDVERLMGEEMVGVVLTDPPYGLDKAIANDDERWLEVLRDAMNLVSAGVWVYCFCAASPRLWREAWEVVQPERVIIWHKPWNLRHPSHGIAWHYEPVLVRPGDPPARENISDVLSVGAIWRKDDPESVGHPTQKPVELMSTLLASAPPGNCYDPFAGSGTTLIACEQTGRVARCIEIEPRYCDVILARWEKATGKSARLA